MRKYKIQVKICNARRYLLEESLDLLFLHSAQPYMVAESSITTARKTKKTSALRSLTLLFWREAQVVQKEHFSFSTNGMTKISENKVLPPFKRSLNKHDNNKNIQNSSQSEQCQTLFFGALELLFAHSAQPYMVVENLITTKK